MCLFKSRQKINALEEAFRKATESRDKALKELENARQEVTALHNVIDRQDELLAKNKKRIKTQQEIINKQNAQLGIEPKRKPRKIEDKDHNPYIKE